MSEIEKGRAQRDAQRTVSGRSAGGASRTQAVLQRLGIELYRERKRSETDQAQTRRPAEEPPDR